MENNNTRDNFDDFFKKNLFDYGETPPADLWGRMEAAIPAAPTPRIVWYRYAAVSAVAAMLVWLVWLQWDNNRKINQLAEQLNTTNKHIQAMQHNNDSLQRTVAAYQSLYQQNKLNNSNITPHTQQSSNTQQYVADNSSLLHSDKQTTNATDTYNNLQTNVVENNMPVASQNANNNGALVDVVQNNDGQNYNNNNEPSLLQTKDNNTLDTDAEHVATTTQTDNTSYRDSAAYVETLSPLWLPSPDVVTTNTIPFDEPNNNKQATTETQNPNIWQKIAAVFKNDDKKDTLTYKNDDQHIASHPNDTKKVNKNTQNQTKAASNWGTSVYAAALYSHREEPRTMMPEKFLGHEEAGTMFSYGASLWYNFNKKWEISLGGQYSTMTHEINHRLPIRYDTRTETMHPNGHYHNDYQTEQYTSYGSTTVEADVVRKASVVDSAEVDFDISGLQEVKTLEIPLKIKYTINNHERWNVALLGGLEYVRKLQQTVFTQNITSNNEQFELANVSFTSPRNIRPMINYIIGASVQYNMTSNVALYAEPSFTKSFKSELPKQMGAPKPFWAGVTGGVKIRF